MRLLNSIYIILILGNINIKNEVSISLFCQDENVILENMANILNKEIQNYRSIGDDKGFYVENGIPVNFFVFNLVDTTNNSYRTKVDIKLDRDGVYHFAPNDYMYSFSQIAIVSKGQMKVFRNLNCPEKGDDIEDVINYVKENINYDENLIKRIEKYRLFGIYFRIDPQSYIDCNQLK